MTMSRKVMLALAALAVAIAVAPAPARRRPVAEAAEKLTTSQAAGFNDFHGHLEARHAGHDRSSPVNGAAGTRRAAPSTSPRTSRRSGENPNTFVVSAGDLIGASR